MQVAGQKGVFELSLATASTDNNTQLTHELQGENQASHDVVYNVNFGVEVYNVTVCFRWL